MATITLEQRFARVSTESLSSNDPMSGDERLECGGAQDTDQHLPVLGRVTAPASSGEEGHQGNLIG